MLLERQLRDWDGKSVNAIMEIHVAHAADGDLMDRLVSLSGRSDLETGATWLLKHRLENRIDRLDADLARKLAGLLNGLSAWDAKLHCLQIYPHITIATEDSEALFRFALACSKDSNKFVRAWAYSGLHQLAIDHPQYRNSVRTVLDEAGRIETAPSAKVRLRRALEQGFAD